VILFNHLANAMHFDFVILFNHLANAMHFDFVILFNHLANAMPDYDLLDSSDQIAKRTMK
jgi:hypothetical protein